MTRIFDTFAGLKARGEVALIPYVTAGDPHLEMTEQLVLEFVRQGADLVELGVPFSDPMADGPANQLAAFHPSASPAGTCSSIKKTEETATIAPTPR